MTTIEFYKELSSIIEKYKYNADKEDAINKIIDLNERAKESELEVEANIDMLEDIDVENSDEVEEMEYEDYDESYEESYYDESYYDEDDDNCEW